MTIVLDHTIVPARDKEESARFFARIFGLEYRGPVSDFAPVRINETLTIDFDNWDNFERHHYAFKVGEAEFDGIFDRVRAEGIAYGSGPRSADNMEINRRNGACFSIPRTTAHAIMAEGDGALSLSFFFDCSRAARSCFRRSLISAHLSCFIFSRSARNAW